METLFENIELNRKVLYKAFQKAVADSVADFKFRRVEFTSDLVQDFTPAHLPAIKLVKEEEIPKDNGINETKWDINLQAWIVLYTNRTKDEFEILDIVDTILKSFNRENNKKTLDGNCLRCTAGLVNYLDATMLKEQRVVVINFNIKTLEAHQ